MKKALRAVILLLIISGLFSGMAAASPETGNIIAVSPGNKTLTQALAACSDGDIIELEDGIYEEPAETFPLTVTKSVTIRAAKGANPVINGPKMLTTFRIEADGVTLEDLDIRFLRTGIYAIGNDMTLERCRFTLADEMWRVSSCGIWCGGIYRATLRNCEFTGCGISLAGPPLSERSADLPKLTGLFEVGEDPEYFSTHTIENCTVNGKPLFYAVSLPEVTAPEDAGEIIICCCGSVTVRNADVSDCSMGMVLVYDEKVTVENCRADRCGVFGIYVAKCSCGEVTGCYAEETNHAMDFRANTNITLRDCKAASCEQGMFFTVMTDSIMRNCTVTDTRQGYFIGGSTGSIITGCTASGCENGFHFEKEDRPLITCCTADNCSVCGIRLDRSSALLFRNTLRNNRTGAAAYGYESLEIADNLFEDNLSCGLYLKNIGFSRICGNFFKGGEEIGLIAEESMGNSVWTGNLLDLPVDLSEVTEDFAVFN